MRRALAFPVGAGYSYNIMAYLRFFNEAGQVTTRSLDSERFVIGRSDSVNLKFDSEMLSREHLAIELETDGRFRVRDLGSRNKTYINGELISESLLNPGDIIRAGDRIAEFVDESAARTRLELDFLTPDRTEPPNSDWVKLAAPTSLTITQLEQLAYLAGDHALTARAEDIADTALAQALLTVEAERGFIALRGEEKTDLRIIAHRALTRDPNQSRTPVSQTFVQTPVLQSVAGRYPKTAGQIDLKQGFAATAVVAPLTYRGRVIGVIYLDRPSAKRPLAEASLHYVTAAGAQIGAMLGESLRRLASLAPREGHAWMTTIRRIQSTVPTVVASNEAFTSAFLSHPGRARCGDLAQVLPLDDHRCCITLVDAGGHGVPGLVQAASILSAVRIAIELSPEALSDPANLFNELNAMIATSSGRQIIPCTFLGVDLTTGKLSYICAGGAPPVVMVAPGRLITLEQPSLVLGVDKEYLYETTRVTLPDRFRTVCYTDGLVEAANPGDEPLGQKKVHEALLSADAFGTAEEITTRISQLVTGHVGRSQADDDASALVVAYG